MEIKHRGHRERNDSKRTLEVLQKTHEQLHRYYILLRLIRRDLERIANNFDAINSGEIARST